MSTPYSDNIKNKQSTALCQLTVCFEFQSRSERRKYCECNFFGVTTNLLNSENLKAAFAQLCNDTCLQFYYGIADPKVRE